MTPGPKPRPVADRFWEKVAPAPADECWLWQAHVNSDGYGLFYVGPTQTTVRAHRRAYEQLIGPIPDGLVLDHLCRAPSCVNPWHLDPVTDKVNVLRAESRCSKLTHCKHGHEFTEANTSYQKGRDGRPRRRCRTCQDARTARRREQRQAARTAWATDPSTTTVAEVTPDAFLGV